MSLRSIAVLCILSISCAVCAPAALYGIYPEAVPNGWNVSSVKLDPATGVISVICVSLFQGGDFEMETGLSALNRQTGLYMYATDTGYNFLYQTNVFSGKPQITLNISSSNIVHITSDDPNGRFIVLEQDFASESMQFLSIVDNDDGAFSFSPPDSANLDFPSSGYMDTHWGYYVLMASTQMNATNPAYRRFNYNSAGTLISTGPIMSTGDLQVFRAAMDPKTLNTVALMMTSDQMHYSVAVIDKNGQATLTKVKSINDGVVLCATYSGANNAWHFVEARSNSTSFLHTFSMDTLKETVVAIKGEWYFYSLEASS